MLVKLGTRCKMPEGPEVETVVRTLEKQIKGNKILDCQIYYDKIIENPKEEFLKNVLNQEFIEFNRQGKFMILRLNQGYLVIHLRMEGKFFIDTSDSYDKHTHVLFTLDDGRFLKYHDTRKFGRIKFVEHLEDHPGLKKLGLDVMDPTLTSKELYQKLQRKSIPIKQALLDQSLVASIGNIYANEICFDAKIHPLTACNKLSLRKVSQLLASSRKVLVEAIEMGGTTIRSYTSSLNVHGRFDQKLMVHQQEICRHCQSKIEKIFINKRGTYFCPKCQKLKK